MPAANTRRHSRRQSYSGRMKARTALGAVAAAGGVAWAARVALGLRSAIGAPVAAIRPYVAGSPNFREGRFHNTEPASLVSPASVPTLVRSLLTRGRAGRPRKVIPLATPLAPADAAELAVTWFGPRVRWAQPGCIRYRLRWRLFRPLTRS